MRPRHALALVLAPFVLVIACGSDGDEPPATGGECASGARSPCSCSSGTEGFRSCLKTQRFGECQCAPVTPGADAIATEDAGCSPTARFYADADGDGFGVEPLVDVCSDGSGAIPPGYASRAGDCDDADARANPDQKTAQAGTRKGAGGGDFDCDGVETKLYADKGSCLASAGCQGSPGWLDSVIPACGETEGYVTGCKVENSVCVTVTAGRTQKCL